MDSELEKFYDRVKLPEVYWKVALKHLPEEPYKKEVYNWIMNIKEKLESGKGLYIYGTYGVGKSAIAAMLLRAALARGFFGLWVNFRSISDYQINQVVFDDAETYFERMLSAPLLVIDELEVKKNKHYNMDVLENVVRTRSQSKKPTIVTSNHSPIWLYELKEAKGKQEEAAMVEGFNGVFSEAFEAIYVIGRNFRDNPVK